MVVAVDRWSLLGAGCQLKCENLKELNLYFYVMFFNISIVSILQLRKYLKRFFALANKRKSKHFSCIKVNQGKSPYHVSHMAKNQLYDTLHLYYVTVKNRHKTTHMRVCVCHSIYLKWSLLQSEFEQQFQMPFLHLLCTIQVSLLIYGKQVLQMTNSHSKRRIPLEKFEDTSRKKALHQTTLSQ